MTIQTNEARPPVQWLSGGAIWAITAASAALGAWGWSVTATGLVAVVLVTLAISSEVLGVRLALRIEDAVTAKAWPRVAVLALLMIGVVGMNAYSGKRALHMIETERAAPYVAAEAQRTEAAREVARIEAEIAAIPTLPANVSGQRLAAYRDARNAELARLEPQRAAAIARYKALPVIEAPPQKIPAHVMLAMLVLIEALKALGPWCLAEVRRPAPVPAGGIVDINAGRALAQKRWAKQA